MGKRKAAKAKNLPTCPCCGMSDRVAHHTLWDWYCRRCAAGFRVNTTFIDGAPFVTAKEAKTE